MKVLRSLFLIGAMISAVASNANANLVVNGGFEDSDVATNSWKFFNSSNVNGWDGSNIEIWDNFDDFVAYEGDQHAELNAHPSNGNGFSIFQEIETVVGGIYTFSFAYAARTDNNEQFSYAAGDAYGVEGIAVTEVIDNDLVREWTLFETEFVANSTLTNIVFTAITPLNATVGNFLDDVIVLYTGTNETEVSAPAGILFMLMGMAGFVLYRKR